MNSKNSIALLICYILAVMSCDKVNEVTASQKESFLLPMTDWEAARNTVFDGNTDYVLSDRTNDTDFFDYIGEEFVTIAYSYDKNDCLVASAVIMKNSKDNDKRLSCLLDDYKVLAQKADSYVYYNEKISTVAMFFGSENDDGLLSLCFSSFTPSSQEDDDLLPYVDLGLSVKWSKCNYGASKPEEEGDYYAWSEVKTKSEYWRENYKYSYNDQSPYVFEYNNPVAEISGTKYDASYYNSDGMWRMPTRQEALELIYACKWVMVDDDDRKGYTVTGPSGKSIFIPNYGIKKQKRDPDEWLMLWVSESYNGKRTADDAYTIETAWQKPVLESQWKAWGIQIRPVLNE